MRSEEGHVFYPSQGEDLKKLPYEIRRPRSYPSGSVYYCIGGYV